jgi:uncharacterized MAPEG superfamily protein
MTGLVAVLGFALWVVLLTFIYALPRLPLIMSGKKEGNAWGREKGETNTGLLMRAKHAHMNALEVLPVFAVIVFTAYFMDKAAVVDTLAAYVLYTRLGQSIVHMIGTSTPLVLVRANLFAAQLLLIVYMGVGLL